MSAFHGANLVALGERHWAWEDSDFRIKLIRDGAFVQTATDIVVEFANPLHQSPLDRFVNGEDVPPADLQRIWQDTTQPGAWDSPVYEDFFRAVRQVNTSLAPERRLRVLAADQPIDWSVPAPQSGWKDDRDRAAASVIEREVLNRGRRALVLFGSGHLYRSSPRNVVGLLQQNPKASWFVILPVGEPGLPAVLSDAGASRSHPEFVNLAEGPVGDLYANEVLEKGTRRVQLVDGRPVIVNGRPVFVPVQVFEPGVRMRDVADGCLNFGNSPPEFVPPPEQLYSGTEYGTELQRRRAVVFGIGSF